MKSARSQQILFFSVTLLALALWAPHSGALPSSFNSADLDAVAQQSDPTTALQASTPDGLCPFCGNHVAKASTIGYTLNPLPEPGTSTDVVPTATTGLKQ